MNILLEKVETVNRTSLQYSSFVPDYNTDEYVLSNLCSWVDDKKCWSLREFPKKWEKVMRYIDSLIVNVNANVLLLYVDAFMNELWNLFDGCLVWWDC